MAEVQELLKWMEARRVRGGLRWVWWWGTDSRWGWLGNRGSEGRTERDGLLRPTVCKGFSFAFLSGLSRGSFVVVSKVE